MSIRQSPFEWAVKFVHILHQLRIHLIFFAHRFDARFFLRSLRRNQRGEIRFATKQLRHLAGPSRLVILVGIVKVGPHLVLKKPGKLLVKQRVIRIPRDALIAQQFNSALHPTPAIVRVFEFNRNIVSHVPRLKVPNLTVVRFEFGDPIRELHRFEIFIFFAQIAGSNPKRIGNQPAKTAQRNRGEGENGRRVFQRSHAGQAERFAIMVHRPLHSRNPKKQHSRHEQQNGFIKFGLRERHHVFPWAVANSRREKVKIPMAARIPPSNKTICAPANPSCVQVMLRPLLNESMGE